MKKHKVLLIATALMLSLSLTACSKTEETAAQNPAPTETTSSESSTSSDETSPKEFSLEELAKFNGKDGSPAYIAVDGTVYDVTDLPPWKDGGHNGFEAGQDLTEAIKTQSPHGVAKLDGVPVVGILK